MVRTIVHCQHLLCKNNFIVIDPKKFLSEPTVLVGIDSNSTWEKFVFLQYCFIDLYLTRKKIRKLVYIAILFEKVTKKVSTSVVVETVCFETETLPKRWRPSDATGTYFSFAKIIHKLILKSHLHFRSSFTSIFINFCQLSFFAFY